MIRRFVPVLHHRFRQALAKCFVLHVNCFTQASDKQHKASDKQHKASDKHVPSIWQASTNFCLFSIFNHQWCCWVLWHLIVTCLTPAWHLIDTCLVPAWHLLGTCLTLAWYLLDTCLLPAWQMLCVKQLTCSTKHLESAWRKLWCSNMLIVIIVFKWEFIL